jgi:hypothetical protein
VIHLPILDIVIRPHQRRRPSNWAGARSRISTIGVTGPVLTAATRATGSTRMAGFARTYNPPPGQKYWPKPGDLMQITGVGFFDVEHGQNGVAPNAIEIHPVLSIRRVD